MPTFTMELWRVIDHTGGVTERDANGVKIMTGGDIGLNYLKTYIPQHRDILIGKFIDRFWNREIGMETISMFQLAVLRKAQEIMPYYNELYRTEGFEFDPVSTIKLHTLATGKEVQNVGVQSDAESTSINESGSRTVNSELPQLMLSANGDYATAGADATTRASGGGTATETKSSDSTTDNDADTTVEGYQAYPSRLVQQYREIILNVDMMILNEFEDCFMGITDVADDHNPRPGYRYPGYF